MVLKPLSPWLIELAIGYNGQRLSMKAVVNLPVKPVLSDAGAHLHVQVGRYGNEAEIKEFVEVGPQKQAVADAVGPAACERLDMSRLKDRQGFFTGDRAPAIVCIGYEHPKGALTEAALY